MKAVATFRFYAELNDFLAPGRRQVSFTHECDGRAPVKDIIEGLGVPHTEVDLLLVNGEPVDFAHIVEGGDRVSIYPVFEAFDIAAVTLVRPAPLRDPRFVLDAHLGRLAAYLRIAGFDCLYRRDFADRELVEASIGERRALLTRDQALLKHGSLTHACYVREINPRGQFAEVVRRFDLRRLARPFTRCSKCNGVLAQVDKCDVAGLMPPRSRALYGDVRRCSGCGRVYWKGTHYEQLLRLFEETLAK